MDGARDKAVDFAHLEHHGTEHYVICKSGAGLVFGHALRLAEFHEGRNVLLGKFCRGFDNLDVGREFHALFLCNLEDFFLLAHEHRHGDAAVNHELCGLHSTRFATFGEHDTLLGLGGLEEQACAEHGLARLPFGGLCGEVRGDALFAAHQAAGAEQFGIVARRINLRIESGGERVVELLGNHGAHAGGTFHHDHIHGIEILLEEVGCDLFHEHGGIVGLEHVGSLGAVHGRLVDGGLLASLLDLFHDKGNFRGHLGFGHCNQVYTVHDNSPVKMFNA